MSYVQKSLLPDEQVIYAGVIHWVIFVPGLAITALGGIAPYLVKFLLAFFFGENVNEGFHHTATIISGCVVLFGVVSLMGAYIRQNTTELAITNRRIIAKYGFISRSTFEIMLSRITGANFDQTILGRILGYGTILVHGAGGDVSPFDVVSDPEKFQKALVSILGKQGASLHGNIEKS